MASKVSVRGGSAGLAEAANSSGVAPPTSRLSSAKNRRDGGDFLLVFFGFGRRVEAQAVDQKLERGARRERGGRENDGLELGK